jgi:hypothetical protein
MTDRKKYFAVVARVDGGTTTMSSDHVCTLLAWKTNEVPVQGYLMCPIAVCEMLAETLESAGWSAAVEEVR